MPTGVRATKEQRVFIIRNFADMTNKELSEATGLCRSAIWHVQKEFHLRKSDKHTHEISQRSGRASAEKRKGKGVVITPETIEKRVASWRKTRKLEKARILFGLPQETKMKVKVQPYAKIKQRAYLKKLGYTLDEVNQIAYYDENTTRALKMESKNRKYPNYYEFRPKE